MQRSREERAENEWPRMDGWGGGGDRAEKGGLKKEKEETKWPRRGARAEK